MSQPSPGAPRSRRTLLVAGAAGLVVVLAALAAVAWWLGPGSGSEAAGERSRHAGTGSTSAPEPEPILFGSHRYTSPCRLLPLEEVERIFGPLGERGEVRQTYVEKSLDQREFRRETDNLDDSVGTECAYEFDDGDLTSLRVEVQQYRSERAATGQWAEIAYLGTGKDSKKLAREEFGEGFEWVVEQARENERDMGGRPVRRAGGPLLYVPGRQDFVTHAGNLLVTLTYGAADFSDQPLTPKEYAAQAPRMKRAMKVVLDRSADAGLDQTPLPTTLDGETAWGDTAYLDPCELLDPDAFEVATGRRPDPAVESDSLERDPAALRRGESDPYLRTPSNSCSRTVRWQPPHAIGGKTSQADLEVRYVEDPADAPRLLERHLLWEYFRDHREQYHLADMVASDLAFPVLDTEADSLYVFDTARSTGRAQAFVTAYFTVGPYELKLSVERNRGLGMYDYDNLTHRQYAKVVDAIVANVHEQTG